MGPSLRLHSNCENPFDEPERGEAADHIGGCDPSKDRAVDRQSEANLPQQPDRASATPINISWPISTPTLKYKSACGSAPLGRPTSASAPAKARPCSRPKVKAISQGCRWASVSCRPGRGTNSSPYGWHIVKVTARRAPPAVSFESVRDQVRDANLADRRANANVAFLYDLRKRYRVVVAGIPDD